LPQSSGLPPGVLAASAGALSKAIYGDAFRNFMGIEDASTGVQEIQNSSSDYNRAYTAESIIYRLVDVRTKAIAQAPLRVYATSHTGKRTAVDHDALAVIKFGNPKNWVAGESAIKKASLASLDLQGRVAWQVATSGRGVPTEVYWLPPAGYEPEGDESGYFKGIKIKGSSGDRERHLPAAALFYHHTLNVDKPWLGTSKIAAARNQINLNLFSLNSNSQFFKNSQRPDWLLTGDWDNTEQNVSMIRRGLRRLLSGESNRSPLIVGKNTTAHLLSTTPKDAEWVKQQKLSLEALCAIFGVPLPVYGNLDNGTYANYDQAVATFWTDTCKGDFDDLADGLTRNFLSRWPDAKGLEFGFDYNQIRGLTEDINKIWERFMAFMDRIEKQVLQRIVTPDQSRVILGAFADQLGLDSGPWQGNVPGGNNFYVPYQNVPIDQLDIQAVIDIMAARGNNPQLEENVPGAPHAADDAAKPAPTRAGWTPRVIKSPHPIPVRDTRLAPIQEKTARKLKRFFQDQQTTVLRAMRGEKAAVRIDINDPLWDRPTAQAELEKMIRDAAGQSAGAAYSASAEDFGLAVAWDDSNPFLERYIGSRLHLIRGIDDTTANDIHAALEYGYQDGDSMEALSERVKAVFRGAIDSRTLKIARTETIQAYGQASLNAYREAGIEKAQMYDGPNDDSADCANVDGQIVSLSEAETLMGLEHPNGTRGVAPYMEPKSASAEQAPSRGYLEAVQKIVGLAIASADSKDAQHQRQLGEAMETLKALAGRAVTVNSPVTVNPSIDVKAATAPNVEFIVAEGAIQNHSDLNVAAGAIQAHTNLSQPGNEDVQIEYDNYGATGKPVRLTRRRH
jgi:HK97 family phage portal protein